MQDISGKPNIWNRTNEDEAMPAYVTVDKRFRFSKGAIALIGLRRGLYVHLLEFGEKDWYFMVNENTDGLRIGHEGMHMVCHAIKVCQIFVSRAKLILGNGGAVSFYIEKSPFTWEGKRIWKIDLDRPFKSQVGGSYKKRYKQPEI